MINCRQLFVNKLFVGGSELGHSADKFGELINIKTAGLGISFFILLAIFLEKIEHSVKLIFIPGAAVAVLHHKVLDEDLRVFLGH